MKRKKIHKARLPEMEFNFNKHTFYAIIKDGSELSEKEETGAETTQKNTQKTTQKLPRNYPEKYPETTQKNNELKSYM